MISWCKEPFKNCTIASKQLAPWISPAVLSVPTLPEINWTRSEDGLWGDLISRPAPSKESPTLSQSVRPHSPRSDLARAPPGVWEAGPRWTGSPLLMNVFVSVDTTAIHNLISKMMFHRDPKQQQRLNYERELVRFAVLPFCCS
uniref:Uncharacterized protein n=1 Tax=Knipowitschia caucasica TaxID=637954 RepID=A0AAV2L662_KNICA